MNSVDIFAIEERIKRLVEKCQILEQENNHLKQQVASHSHENQKLSHKNDLAISRLEGILQHLRTLAGNEL